MGFRDLWYLIAGPAISLFIIWVEVVVARRNVLASGYLTFTGNLAMFVVFAWITSPILVMPLAVIAVTLMATHHHRLIRTWFVAVLVIAATLAPWLVELLGVSAARTSAVGGDLIMHTMAHELDPSATVVVLVLYLVTTVNLAGLLSRLQDAARRAARQKLELQTWQLRQLVPRSS